MFEEILLSPSSRALCVCILLSGFWGATGVFGVGRWSPCLSPTNCKFLLINSTYPSPFSDEKGHALTFLLLLLRWLGHKIYCSFTGQRSLSSLAEDTFGFQKTFTAAHNYLWFVVYRNHLASIGTCAHIHPPHTHHFWGFVSNPDWLKQQSQTLHKSLSRGTSLIFRTCIL